MIRPFLCAASAFALLASIGDVTSASAASQPAIPKLDPNVVRALDTGLVGPWQRGPRRPGRARVLIELTQPATPAALRRLAGAGAALSSAEGRTLAYDRFVPADVTPGAARAVAALPDVIHVSLASARGPLPLDNSAALLRLADARGARPATDQMTGKGVLIADIDTLVDPFHPTFFKGDGGYYDWIDVDGDGVLTPGTDAIDLDADGKAGAMETAVLLRAETTTLLYGFGRMYGLQIMNIIFIFILLDNMLIIRMNEFSVQGHLDLSPV